MHQGRKPLRKKRKRRTSKNKLTYGIIAVVLIVISLFTLYSLSFNPSSDNHTGQPKAALIDHLGFSSPPPNTTFNSMCRTILRNAGFSYTYHGGEEVTVDFYRNLPLYDYSLIILRVHSAVIKDSEGSPTNLVGLFTSEIFNEATEPIYRDDLENSRLALSHLFTGSNDTYFGITPFFVKEKMEGNFKDTVIIMMGCEGLNHTSMADAFVHERKAKVYISWTGLVSISHTDHSATQLLQSLLLQKQTIKNAVQKTSPDPTWPLSELDYYPNEGDEDVGNYNIQDFISGLTTNVAQIRLIFGESSRSRVKSFQRPLSN